MTNKKQQKYILNKIPAKPVFDYLPGWTKLRKEWIAGHPSCACCGITTDLAVHHILPIHLFPEKQLDQTNLITLCQYTPRFCHFVFGHFFDWWGYNSDIRRFAPLMLRRIQNVKYS